MDHRSGARRSHPPSPEPLAPAAGRCAARSSSSPARCWRCCCRPRASRRFGSAPPPSSRSASSPLLVFGGARLLCARPAAAPPGHRHPGRAVPRGTRSVARSRDPERGRSTSSTAERRASHSPRLVERLVEQAIDAVPRRSTTAWRSIAPALQRHALTLAAVAAAAALLIALGPAYLRHGLSALLDLSRSAEAASPYKIEVQPGNTKVPRGADQTVRAKLVGFSVEGRRR